MTQCHPHPSTESTDSSTTRKQKHVVKVAREALKITFLLVGYIALQNQITRSMHGNNKDGMGIPPKTLHMTFVWWVYSM